MTDIQYTSTVVSMSVHSVNENPLFGESVTRVSIEDEGAGAFVKINQDGGKSGEVRLDMEEMDFVVVCARKMVADYEKITVSGRAVK